MEKGSTVGDTWGQAPRGVSGAVSTRGWDCC